MKTSKYTLLLSSLVILLISCNGNHSKQNNELLASVDNNHFEDPCEFNGIKLYGKVKFVTSFPDFTIRYVKNFADIKVKFVESFPNDCGKWQIVESFPDFKVQVVESNPDLEVQIVNSFPGMN